MVMSKRDGRKLDAAAQEEVRRRAVDAVVSRGMSKAEAMRVFGVSKGALFGWLKRFAKGGEQALAARRRGRPKGSTLPARQATAIRRLIVAGGPEQQRFPFALWTREAVAALIKRRTGRSLSLSTVGRLLGSWGFTPQKPVRRAYERDPDAVRRWLDHDYPAIERLAREMNAEIHWGDELGLRSDHQAGTSYSPRGRTPVILGTGRRFRCNMISTVTNRGRLAFMIFDGRFTAGVMIEFLGRLLRHAKRPVILIVDGHPVHRSAAVRRWVEARADRIRLFFLPGYSPDLNPDELLNHDVKANAVGRRRARDLDGMKDNLRSYLRGTQRRPDIVTNYFRHESVRYAA